MLPNLPSLRRTCAAAAASLPLLLGAGASLQAQTVTVDPGQKHQVIDGFGTCNVHADEWCSHLYFDDLGASIMRMDFSPHFKAPYSDYTYNSPWFHGHPGLPGPDNNNVRTYTNASDYTKEWGGHKAQIAVMGPDIDKNITLLDFSGYKTMVAAQYGASKKEQLGDFKLYGSMWSPAPWVKFTSGGTIHDGNAGVHPKQGVTYPFIWNACFAGGKLDVSNTPMPEFDDTAMGGNGPTSALTQFARCTVATLRGIQNTYHVKYYGISIQNELNFEEFYNSCTYPLSSQYITALKAARAEMDKYPDLKDIKILGPEDLLGGDEWSMWQLGGGSKPVTHKNLHYLQDIGKDPVAEAAIDTFCVHGYANNGGSAVGADPFQWRWWAEGWKTPPKPGLPVLQGFTAFHKKSWMTETSGEHNPWLFPVGQFPKNGGWSIALKIQQALTAGQESGWVYWTFAEGNKPEANTASLTSEALKDTSPKYVAAKHFFKYIRPNAVRVEAKVDGDPGLTASAYVHDKNHTTTVVLVNSEDKPINVAVNLPSMVEGGESFHAFTSQDNNFWQPSQVAFNGGKSSVTVPGYGVVTLYNGSVN